MSLEQMTKPELVRDLRSANQKVKELEAKLEEFENVGNKAESSAELPYLAVSQFRENNGAGGYAVKIAYDLDGRMQILSKEYFNENYKVNWEAVKFLETVIEKQKEVVGNSTVQDEASNGAQSGETDE